MWAVIFLKPYFKYRNRRFAVFTHDITTFDHALSDRQPKYLRSRKRFFSGYEHIDFPPQFLSVIFFPVLLYT